MLLPPRYSQHYANQLYNQSIKQNHLHLLEISNDNIYNALFSGKGSGGQKKDETPEPSQNLNDLKMQAL